MKRVIVSLIAAMAENRVIGSGRGIPWDIPSDRRRFRELTMGHTLVMGRTTYESIGRPLPGRKTIVLTRTVGYPAPGCVVMPDLKSAFDVCGGEEVFVCGGAEVYRQALAVARRIYLTVVHCEVSGDTFFPAIPEDFVETEREHLPGPIPATFLLLSRLP